MHGPNLCSEAVTCTYVASASVQAGLQLQMIRIVDMSYRMLSEIC